MSFILCRLNTINALYISSIAQNKHEEENKCVTIVNTVSNEEWSQTTKQKNSKCCQAALYE